MAYYMLINTVCIKSEIPGKDFRRLYISGKHVFQILLIGISDHEIVLFLQFQRVKGFKVNSFKKSNFVSKNLENIIW